MADSHDSIMYGFPMKSKRFYLHTIGCQMNVYDSEQMAMQLSAIGYKQIATLDDADLIIVNTCTVRAKAEQKAFSFIGRLAKMKRLKKGMIIGVAGCVAQQEGERILERMPAVDLVLGTQAINRLPHLIQQIETRHCRIVDVDMVETPDIPDALVGPQEPSQVSKFVTIMRGCDNFCAYCAVPYVRGREMSRKPDSILREIRALVDTGVKEVTLLGQNVNSYGKKQNLCSFAELLAEINQTEGLYRIRFTTSHPKDLGTDLILGFKDIDKLCSHIHLPVQSGSNRVLKRMNRKYTREQYLDKVAELRDTCPQIAITSDIIVGFPGEKETDFEQTIQLIETVQFDGLFAFQYSDRPPAPAVKLPDKVDTKHIGKRLQAILTFQEKLTRSKNQQLVGSIQSVLTDGVSKKEAVGNPAGSDQSLQWSGRTSTNKIVNFQVDASTADHQNLTGKMVGVHIEKGYSHSLYGRAVNLKPSRRGLKGVENYAA